MKCLGKREEQEKLSTDVVVLRERVGPCRKNSKELVLVASKPSQRASPEHGYLNMLVLPCGYFHFVDAETEV